MYAITRIATPMKTQRRSPPYRSRPSAPLCAGKSSPQKMQRRFSSGVGFPQAGQVTDSVSTRGAAQFPRKRRCPSSVKASTMPKRIPKSTVGTARRVSTTPWSRETVTGPGAAASSGVSRNMTFTMRT